MAIAKYKAVREFEYNGRDMKTGEELILKDSEGELLVEEGLMVVSKYLDPEDAKDREMIEEFEKREEEKHEEYVDEQAVRDKAHENSLEQADGEVIKKGDKDEDGVVDDKEEEALLPGEGKLDVDNEDSDDEE